jgi:hypothetical protein
MWKLYHGHAAIGLGGFPSSVVASGEKSLYLFLFCALLSVVYVGCGGSGWMYVVVADVLCCRQSLLKLVPY